MKTESTIGRYPAPGRDANNNPVQHSSNVRQEGKTNTVPWKQLDATTTDLLNGYFNVTVQSNVGSGYAGTVYKCVVDLPKEGSNTDNGSGGREKFVIALKVLPKDKVKAKAATNEVELLRAASGPHVLMYVSSIESLDAYWILTEFCSKGDLHGMLRLMDNCYVMAREYLRDVVAGLECLHDQLIAHADLKMKNILISDRNVAKIADFGFAKQYSSEDDRETVCHGTRDYWAPEMFWECPSYSPFKADIYALGVTFVGVCEKRPIKLKHDSIKNIIGAFRDQHQVALFRGMLNDSVDRWSFDRIKSNLWLNECVSPPHTPV